MNDFVPADRAEIEVHMLLLGVLEHAAGIDLTFLRADSEEDGLFEFPRFPG